jgi:hypothetical protein
VLRYRFYDIDVVINRALVYGSLTVMLAVVYFGGVTITQAVFHVLTGQQEQPQLAVVVSTLAIAALFNLLRRRVQSSIDRSFYRKKYDVAKILEAFSARMRDETDLEGLGEHLTGAVGEAMQPAHTSLWLRPTGGPKSERPKASRRSVNPGSCQTVRKVSRTGQPSHHQAVHRYVDERLARLGEPLVGFAHPPVVVYPRKRPLEQAWRDIGRHPVAVRLRSKQDMVLDPLGTGTRASAVNNLNRGQSSRSS